MRKIIVLEFITLDGVIQAPGAEEEDISGEFKFGGWTVPLTDEFMGKVMDGQMSGEYDLLLGRKTYDIWAGYWPQHTEGWPQVNRITKYVVSKTLNNPKWENTVVLQDINELKQLKEKDGSPLQVYGSANLAQTLLKNNLIDELWLKIYPITLGKGKRLFADGTIPKTWKMTKGEIAPNGVIVANFQPAGEVKTGTF
jgi:dihydrofolate reductase